MTEPVVLVMVPPHWGVTGAETMVTLVGRVSVMETFVRSVVVSLLLITMVITLVCPTHIVFGANVLLKEGG